VQEIVTEEVATANDAYWAAETVSNELVAEPLQAWKVLMLGPWGGASVPPALEDVLTADARIGRLDPTAPEVRPVTSGVVEQVWDPARHELVGAEQWYAELQAAHESCRRVRWALWKPAQVRLTDYGAEAKLKYRFNRELPSGEIRHDTGYWMTEWVRTDEGWRCRRAAPYKSCRTLVSEAPHFVDATLEAFRDTPLDPRVPTAMAGFTRAVVLADFDGDEDLDVFTTLPGSLLYNRGDGTFVDESERLEGKNDLWTNDSEFFGSLAADFDRDGDLDLFVAVKRTHALLFLQEEGRFRPKPVVASHTDCIPSSLAAHDVDGDGWLDVFLTNYGPFIHPGPNTPLGATNGKPNQMLRGLPGGEFEDVTAAWGMDEYAERWTFAGAFGDADGDGDVDLYSANDFGPNVLYRRVDGERLFRPELEDATDIDAGFSMSATFEDLDGDLDLDLYVSNMSSTAANRVRVMDGDPREEKLGVDMNDIRRRMSKGNTILVNEGDRLAEASEEYGAKSGSWAWGTALFDYDCDLDVDIASLNGMWTQGANDGRDL